MTESPMAGLAVGLSSDDHPMAYMAKVDPCANVKHKITKDDLRTRVHFSRRARAKAKKHWYRKTMQPTEPGKPVFPDKKDVEGIQLILDREKAARKRAWHMADSLNKGMGEFDDTDERFFKIVDPEKNSDDAEPPLKALFCRSTTIRRRQRRLIPHDRLQIADT